MELRVNALRREKYHFYLLIQEKKADSLIMTVATYKIFLHFTISCSLDFKYLLFLLGLAENLCQK
jgi:hypothetical protein